MRRRYVRRRPSGRYCHYLETAASTRVPRSIGFASLLSPNLTRTGGPAAVRAYIEMLLPDGPNAPALTRGSQLLQRRRPADRRGRAARRRGPRRPYCPVALAWVLKNPVVATQIVGATKPHHLPDAVATLDIQLSEDEIRTIEGSYTAGTPTGF